MTRSLKFLAFLVPTLLGSLAQAKDLPNFDAYAAAKASPVTRGLGLAATPPAFASSFDAKTSAPTFLWTARGPSSAAPAATFGPLTADIAARAHLERHTARYGVSMAALANAKVTQIHNLGQGAVVVVFRQEIDGIELFHYDAKVLMDQSLGVVAIGGHLHPAGGGKPKGPGFRVPEAKAIAIAIGDLYGGTFDAPDLSSTKETKAGFEYYELAPTAAVNAAKFSFDQPARVKKIYFPLPDRLVPAFYLEIWANDGAPGASSAYGYVIAADDGRLLYRENLTHEDAFNYRIWADTDAAHRPTDGPLADFTPHPTGMPDKSYPPFVAPTLVTMDGFNKNPNATFDPWLLAGAMQTNGNNVDAYTDDDAPDGFSANDLRASVTSPGAFDRVFDTNADPQSSPNQRMAAVTQIFYVTNWLHDWWYDSGFVEAAGNGQKDNYGRGGVAGDPLHAEAQDGAPNQRNNANMSAGVDGASPRMQMYVWDGPSSMSLTTMPGNQSLPTMVAAFGPQSFNVTGSVVLVNDGTAPTTDACQGITNNVAGKIALVDRGTCTFKQKAVNAQAAGAIGVLLADNQANPAPPVMADGTPNVNVTIPMMSMTEAAGTAMKTALQNGPVSAALVAQISPSRDGTIDNTVVAHEWGHYLHLRQVACGSQQCLAQSEGWGDFNSAMLELRQGDNLSGTYATAQYATAAYADPGYFGIRRYPYSTDLTKDPLTFKDIGTGVALPAGVPTAPAAADNAEVHNAGEIWATMLFESYVGLLAQTELAAPPYTFEEAHRRMGNYVEAGLKLAPTDPTYTEQRDGILAAAAAADASDFAVLAQGFAKRGAGTCAVSPARASTDLTGVVESFTLNPNLEIVSVKLDDSIFSCDSDGNLDADEAGNLSVEVMNAGPATMVGTTVTVQTQSADLTFPSGTSVVLAPLAAYATATAKIKVTLADGVMMHESLPLTITVENADACTPKLTLDTAPLANFDEAPKSSASDDVEASTTTWTLLGAGASNIWSRVEATPGNHLWRGIDYPSPSDTSLESPPLVVSAADPLVLTFSHRHSFETSMATYWDGGVIEVSTDGTTWTDVATIVDPGYGGTIGDPKNQAMNVLKGRKGFVAQNASWPAMDKVTVNMGMSLAGKTIQIRFRIGTDDAQGDLGWDIDDIALAGITNLPFDALIDDQATCEDVPIAVAGPDQTVMSGDLVTLDGSKSSDPEAKPITFVWSETAGPAAPLSGGAMAVSTFVAPVVAMPTTISMQLTVSNGKGSASDQIDVHVNPGMSSSTSSASGSSGSSSASSGAGGAALKAGDAGLGDGPILDGETACGCEVPGTPERQTPALAALGLLGLALYRRRRRAE